MNLEGVDNKEIDFENLTIADKWILNKLNETAKETNENIKNYRIGEMAHTLYDFFWNSYCDWYVEIAKIQLQDENKKLNTQRVLRYVLDMTLRLLHPVMPHITETIWQLLPKNSIVKAIMLEKFPVWEKSLSFKQEEEQMELVFETIKSLRNLRQSFNIPVSTKLNIEVLADKQEEEIFRKVEPYIHRLARVEDIKYVDEKHTTLKQSASSVVSNSKIIVPLAGLIDLNEEIKRQNKKLEKLLNEKNGLMSRINNEKFMANAKPELIEQTKNRVEEITVQEKAINDLISSLQV